MGANIKRGSALEKFKELVSGVAAGEASEADFWRLQVAARDAFMEIDVSSTVSPKDALVKVCEVFQLLLGGANSSVILKNDGHWIVAAASGKGADRITGLPLDMDRNSVSSLVISSGKPYFFSNIEDQEGVARENDPSRYSSSNFCSFPLLGFSGEVLGVVSAAGMPSAHPVFSASQDSLDGVLEVISGKVVKLRKNEELKVAKEDLKVMKEAETVRERLLYMTIHDMKNPLTLISANLAHLEGLELDEAAREIARLSRYGSERILDMVKSILDSHKMEKGVLELYKTPVDLLALARDAAHEFEVAALSDEVTVVVEGADGAVVDADESIIRRVLGNLIDNALRHSPMKGTVTVDVEADDYFARMSVRDEGEGVAIEDQERIFDIFESIRTHSEEASKGTHGLGLTFCRMAAEAHGGSIAVESEPEQGAKFTVTLPKRTASKT